MVNTTGINCITRACIGSGGVGLSFIWKNIEAPIINGRIKYGSITDISVIHKKNGAWRSSTDSIITQYKAMNTRSEERRVGKESRYRGVREYERKRKVM